MTHYNVYTLLCHRDMEMASITYPLLIKNLNNSQKLIVVGDGSLTDEDCKILTEMSELIQVIRRSDREHFVLDKIAGFENCIKFRDEYPPAFKIIDIPLLAKENGDRLIFTDSDIIYYSGSKPYFEQDRNVYLRTDAIKISIKLSKVLLKYNWKVPYRFNSGYFSFGLEDFDLSLIDYFVSRPDVRNIPWVIEQTGWALLFGKASKSLVPDQQQFVCAENFNGPNSGTLAIHLIADLKNKVSEWSIKEDLNVENIQVKFYESRNVNYFDWFKKTIKRLF